MYQGFYNLASGMLTQSRNLNVISNNMVNVQTAGYKSDTMVSKTFEEEMLIRTGTRYKEGASDLATVSKIKTADRTYTNYEQGSFTPTGGIYDFALSGTGFFCVQTTNGERYTRNGAFYVDEEGYLTLAEAGRVLSTENQPIQITDENFSVDGAGNIYTGDEEFGTLKVVDFADYEQLHKEDNGLFSTGQAAVNVWEREGNQTSIVWQTLETANVDMVEEMTTMMSSQRALQSAAQVLKMYDTILNKACSDVGRI
ncbi:MAG: flagellar hook-basal body protein [Lachnospiraceae bacterium]|nr:flagellar hook-basal body protein [Lachnospiraceae bacterium]